MKAFPLLLQAEALLVDLAALPAIKLLSPLPGAKDLAARRTRRTRSANLVAGRCWSASLVARCR